MDNEKEIFQKTLGSHIATLRRKQGISQTKLAYRCGKDKQSISRLETGKVNPSAFYLFQLAQALDVPVKDLFDFDD